MKVFIDTNIFLDYFLLRNADVQMISNIFLAKHEGVIILGTSPIAFSNLSYFLIKSLGKKEARIQLKNVLFYTNIWNTNESIIKSALESDFNDLEDAYHYFTAESEDTDFILTRNIKDFKGRGKIPAILPTDLFINHIQHLI